jgi:putative phage-type endonuclease
MTNEQWHANRRKGIGGSDIGAILGLSPYRTPMQVYLEKIGESEPQEETPAMYWGKVLEDVVAQEYSVRNIAKVQRVNQMLTHRSNDWMLANIDRAIINPEVAGNVRWKDGRLTTDRILECKTANGFAAKQWGESGTDQVPDTYICQVQWYMEVTQTTTAALAVLIGGNDYRQFIIERDSELIADMMEQASTFWDRTQQRIAPDPSTFDEAKTKWSRHVAGKTRIVDVSTSTAIEQIKSLKDQIKSIESEIDQLNTQVCSAFEDAETIEYNGVVLATWKTQQSTRLDNKALKAAHPELAEQFSTTTETRVLRIK